MDMPQEGDKYRHFQNGNVYEVMCLAHDTGGEIVVVHKGEDGRVYIRSLSNFCGFLFAAQQQRFAKVVWNGRSYQPY